MIVPRAWLAVVACCSAESKMRVDSENEAVVTSVNSKYQMNVNNDLHPNEVNKSKC